MFIDTHAHLCDPSFHVDLDAVLDRAGTAGVKKIVAVGEHLADARRTLELAGRYPCLLPAAGLYPEYADPDAAAEMISFVRKHGDRLAAIGEVGLDFWVGKEEREREVQRDVFARFIDLAGELDLPLNVHSRSAGRHALGMLLERGARRVQMHAFDGRAATAMPGVEAGFFFSIPPSVVRSRQKQKLVRQLPLSCLLVESDSPVLGPEPAVRNEPANVVVAVRAIAQIKEVPEEEVREAVWENTIQLYGYV